MSNKKWQKIYRWSIGILSFIITGVFLGALIKKSMPWMITQQILTMIVFVVGFLGEFKLGFEDEKEQIRDRHYIRMLSVSFLLLAFLMISAMSFF